MPEPASTVAPRHLDPIFATREFDVPPEAVADEPPAGPAMGLVSFDEEDG